MSRILIVEDEESIAELEKDYLELSGFEVEIENDGEAGLKRALEEDFDLSDPGSDAAGGGRLRDLQEDPGSKEYADHHGIGEEGRHRQDPRSGTGRGRLYHETVQPERDGGACQGASGAV